MSAVNKVSTDHSAPEVTLEVTQEVTPELTPVAAVTPEVAPEPTATPEVTPAVSSLAITAWPASVAQASQPVFDWWMHHWMDASHPLARLQSAWMESVVEAIEVEAEFLNACMLSNAKVWSYLADTRSLEDCASLHSVYHEVAKDITDAHMARLGKVAELPKDFKQRLWEEIC